MSNTYVKDRDEALLSLDEEKIRTFCKKYNKQLPDNPVIFWAGIYKSILAMKNSPADIRRKAEDWLDSHGFQRGFGSVEEQKDEPEERFPRHSFEHVILPFEFYKWGDRLLNQVIDGDRHYMADLYGHAVEAPARTFKASFFKILRRNYVLEKGEGENATIVRIDLPKPSQVTECRRIYLCRNEDTGSLMYFTSELSMQGTYYLCAWTKEHAHLLLRMDPAVPSEFDNVAELFGELAGYEPPVTAAM
ncbi:MAG: hypothetical protein J6D53_00300 [Blautia sp.]|nr:hypothetical protein [Blautia sp.]